MPLVERVRELESGEWGIGGKALSAADIKGMLGQAACASLRERSAILCS